MRSIHARSSSSLRALASESIGWRWVTLVSAETGSPPMRCVGRVGRQQLGVLGLDGAQLVEQLVVLVVGDARVVEHVVAPAVLGELLAQLRGALDESAWRPCSLHLAGGRGEQPRQVVLGQGVEAGDVGEVEVHGRDRDVPRVHGGEVGPRLVVEARVGAVDPVAPAAVLVLGVELELVAVDALAQARDLDAVRARRRGR